MKLKKFFTAFGLSALLVGGALFAVESAKGHKASRVKATTGLGTITFSEANADSEPTKMFGIYMTENAAPAGWDTEACAPIDANSGVFVNGTRVGTEIKKVGPYSYYIAVPGGTIGTIATVKGTWANSTYHFTVEDFTRQCVANPGKWEYALEDYDVVSLEDVQIPDVINSAINTEDNSEYSYIGYGEDGGHARRYSSRRKGVFALSNPTRSFAFRFNLEYSSVQAAGWLDIRIGATGGWTIGHYMQFSFSNEWSLDGCCIIFEKDGGSTLQSVEIATDFSAGSRLVELGVVRVKGYSNLCYIYYKSNSSILFGQYWTLSNVPFSTKIGVYTARTDLKFTNAPVEHTASKLTISSDSTASALYFNTANDILPVTLGDAWNRWFVPVDSTGFEYNGVDHSEESANFPRANYFKKVGASNNAFYFNFGDAGITPTAGDIVKLAGEFRLVDFVGADNVTVLYRVYIEEINLEFDGTTWSEVNLGYEAADFAKDLLKMTLSICTGAGGNNKAALTPVWATLAGADYYGSLMMEEKEILQTTAVDSTIVVPTSADDVDAMTAADALGAALYRYEYCVAKYQLSAFISNRNITVTVGAIKSLTTMSDSNLSIIVAIVATTSILAFIGGALIIRKRKEDR